MPEETSANQSTEQVIDQQQVNTEHPAAETTATTQETAAEGIRVKYNKEERVIPNEEAPTWIQKGLNYDKLQERTAALEDQAKALERTAKVYGFTDIDSYLQALDKYEQEQAIREEAEKLGVDESVIIQHLAPMKQKLSEYEQQMQSVKEREAQLRLEQEVNQLKATYPDFEQYQLDALQLVIDKGYGIEDAYKLVSYQDKLANIGKQTEAETIRKIQQNAMTTPGALGAEGTEHKTGFAAMSKDEQRKFIEDVKAGRRTTFD
ncbi:putative DNA-binding protein YlxM (UPF0122 family) [Fontibacillus solani]|uniref:Putative DNA-binding protein YlxM (UPF0122 family) n=1 Tax=Fontibacillus solani TaxID=1572857 RepID=A0A7W3XUJ6_9BACL|nr:hypothetical protein [Fontibacillus solani]MBA9088728.1 putative DNA-binding protein YlxM (UPF0122 family) [Fontibacillus solani]